MYYHLAIVCVHKYVSIHSYSVDKEVQDTYYSSNKRWGKALGIRLWIVHFCQNSVADVQVQTKTQNFLSSKYVQYVAHLRNLGDCDLE